MEFVFILVLSWLACFVAVMLLGLLAHWRDERVVVPDPWEQIKPEESQYANHMPMGRFGHEHRGRA